MRILEHPNMDKFICPICGKSDDKSVVLVGINDMKHDNIIEFRQYHLDCIDLTEVNYPEGFRALFQEVKNDTN